MPAEYELVAAVCKMKLCRNKPYNDLCYPIIANQNGQEQLEDEPETVLKIEGARDVGALLLH